jgi:hypothetical protein
VVPPFCCVAYSTAFCPYVFARQADKSERVLFPDRGSKTELGKVFHPLAFGSTKPRNMMPGHLTAGKPHVPCRRPPSSVVVVVVIINEGCGPTPPASVSMSDHVLVPLHHPGGPAEGDPKAKANLDRLSSEMARLKAQRLEVLKCHDRIEALQKQFAARELKATRCVLVGVWGWGVRGKARRAAALACIAAFVGTKPRVATLPVAPCRYACARGGPGGGWVGGGGGRTQWRVLVRQAAQLGRPLCSVPECAVCG